MQKNAMSIASAVEHTRLAADTTPHDVETICKEAIEFAFAGVCVAPCYVALAKDALRGSPVRVVTVVGFPLGNAALGADLQAARIAVEEGVHEIDMVIPIGLALASELRAVERHISALRRVAPDHVLKVILEVGFFAPSAVEVLARIAVDAGADYLKTATGFGPRGAIREDVELLAQVAHTAGRTVLVKASGGIRTLAQARELVLAGAARLGTSRGVDLAKEELAGD
jgi:deoxyribose-phosphate aldolase